MGRFPPRRTWPRGRVVPGRQRVGRQTPLGGIRHGDIWLADALAEAAWAAAPSKDTYLSARFWRIAVAGADGRRKKKAAVAVAHKILIIPYYLMSTEGALYETEPPRV